MDINNALKTLYNSKWPDLQQALSKLEPQHYTNPFLLGFDNEQIALADRKVMIIGQETKGWCEQSPNHSIDELMSVYQDFRSKRNPYKGFKKSAFWQAFGYFEHAIRRANPTKNVHFCWNNINKIGRPAGKTGVSSSARNAERQYFGVIANEVALYAPDIVIFMTGPSRDGDIRFHFPDATFSPLATQFKTREVAQVSSQCLPEKSVRIYHPSYFKMFHSVKPIALRGVLEQSLNKYA